MKQNSSTESALQDFHTTNSLNKYAKENLDLLEPVEYVLNNEQNASTMQYVPILQTFKNLLQHEDIFSHVMNRHVSNDGLLRDICDGTVYKNNDFFKDGPNKLQLLLFYDDFTVTNPIGHAVKKCKIGAFYMMLANLPPKYRSQLKVIQLVALVEAENIKIHGFRNILDPLIQDLKILEEEGITVRRQEGDCTLKGSLISVIGDNLGAHAIGGFTESFTTLRCCRFCFLPRDLLKINTESEGLPLRTREMYNQQSELVEENADLQLVYGLRSSSALNDLCHFHVIGGLPSNLAHDLFEGVVPIIMRDVIKYCVQSGFFTLEFLNRQITNFKYSEVDKANKPKKVPDTLAKLKVNQSASQCWCLFRLLPLMLGDCIPQGDSKWEILLLLQTVVFYLLVPSIKPGHVEYIREIIEEFLQSFLREFTSDLTPKFHFMLHYADQISHFGPLLHLQTLRFESKHSYFKELAQRNKCKKNLCKSLATRHQYLQCVLQNEKYFLNSEKLDTVGGGLVPVTLLKNKFQNLLNPYLNGSRDVFQCKSVTFQGTKYVKGCCLVTGFRGSLFQFSKIDQCFVIGGTPYALMKKMKTLQFDRHINGFIVEETASYELLRLSNREDVQIAGIYKHGSRKVVVLKFKQLFEEN